MVLLIPPNRFALQHKEKAVPLGGAALLGVAQLYPKCRFVKSQVEKPVFFRVWL